MLILFIIGIILIIIDQTVKAMIINNLVTNQVIDLGLVKLEYVQNYATVFGKDINVLMILFSIVIVAIFVYWFLTKFTVHVKNKKNYIPFILVVSGFISNIIDRISVGFGISYLKIPLILQDVSFNIAGIYIFAGLFLTAIFYMLKVNEEAFEKIDINSLNKKEKKK